MHNGAKTFGQKPCVKKGAKKSLLSMKTSKTNYKQELELLLLELKLLLLLKVCSDCLGHLKNELSIEEKVDSTCVEPTVKQPKTIHVLFNQGSGLSQNSAQNCNEERMVSKFSPKDPGGLW